MSAPAADGFGVPLSLRSEHGLVHGRLDYLAGAAGLVVMAHLSEALEARDNVLAAHFHRRGLSTLSVNLLAHREERYADVYHNVPLLAKRLLEFLDLLKQRGKDDGLAPQALGLCAANAASPVAVRVAALRDREVAALVCRGGMIDLAGALYLRELASPLLLLVEQGDAQQLANAERALHELHGEHQLRRIPEIGIGYAASPGFEAAANAAADWFIAHLARAETAGASQPPTQAARTRA